MQPVTTPRIFSGRYELTHLVARGGMAQVYRARDRLLDRPVALKVLFPELSVDRAFVERFRREAQAAANLSHPNIVPVFDWGEDGGTYYIVMEYIDGQPLSQALRAGGPMPPARVAHIGARVADALAYAHRHGVVHRDVKPGNVLLTNDEQVKVTDFGIARAVNTEESLTQTGAVMGTATYFSPEQAEGVGVDARSDIYSLGVVLFEMVAGRPPFLGDSPVAVASKHVRERPPVLSDLNPTVPPPLEAIVAKAMAKSADQRYQSASDLRADLQRFAEGRPVSAADPATLAIAAMGPATGVLGAVSGNPTEALLLGDGRRVTPPLEPESHVGRWVLLLLALLAILGLVVYFVLQNLGYIGASDKLTMPTVRGQPVAAATSTLEADGLVVTSKARQPSTTVGSTDVISTRPKAGSRAHKGEHVALVVSTGAVPKVTVPTVKGKTYSRATATLSRKGLHPTELLVASTEKTGTVLTQTPPAGTRVKKGSTVTLKVSTQNSVVVPGLIGDTVAQAGSALGAAGLAPGILTKGCSSQYGTGIVMNQTPAGGTKVAPHAKVNFEQSTGPCNVSVHNVVGKSETAAIATLSSQGLKAVPVTTATCVPGTSGKVLAQTPRGGTTVPTGSTVSIDVCKPPVASGTTTPKPGHTKPVPTSNAVRTPPVTSKT